MFYIVLVFFCFFFGGGLERWHHNQVEHCFPCCFPHQITAHSLQEIPQLWCFKRKRISVVLPLCPFPRLLCGTLCSHHHCNIGPALVLWRLYWYQRSCPMIMINAQQLLNYCNSTHKKYSRLFSLQQMLSFTNSMIHLIFASFPIMSFNCEC